MSAQPLPATSSTGQTGLPPGGLTPSGAAAPQAERFEASFASLGDLIRGLNVAAQARVAVVGIGNDLNGDDAAGVLVARRLLTGLRQRADHRTSAFAYSQTAGWAEQDVQPDDITRRRVVVMDAGPSPEAFTGPLRRFGPSLILLVDAAELRLSPGSVACFDWSAAEGMSASTHTLPPSMVAGYLVRELGCQAALIGIQPRGLELDGGVSPAVDQAVQMITGQLLEALRDFRL